MKRCPACSDDHEDDALVCGSCGLTLREVDSSGAMVGAAVVTPPADARLGTFHPVVAERLGELLYRRGIAHTVYVRDDSTEIRVAADRRDELRAEFTLAWSEITGGLDPEVLQEIRASGGLSPGWYDAPQGGHIDRTGRLVVSAVEDDEDEARIVGPAMLAGGAILAIVGWYVLDSPAAMVIGVGLLLFGLFSPR